jgi:hypothetical protein
MLLLGNTNRHGLRFFEIFLLNRPGKCAEDNILKLTNHNECHRLPSRWRQPRSSENR